MPCVGKTLLVDHNALCLQVVRPRWAETGVLSGRLDGAAVEAKAQFGDGLRVAVEASNKPLSLLMGYLTET